MEKETKVDVLALHAESTTEFVVGDQKKNLNKRIRNDMDGNETDWKPIRKIFQIRNDLTSTNMDVEDCGCMKESSEQGKKIRRNHESTGSVSPTEPHSYDVTEERNVLAEKIHNIESGLQSSLSSDEVSSSWVRPQKSRKLKRDEFVEENMVTENSKGTTYSICSASRKDSPLLLPVKSCLALEMNCNAPDVNPDIFLSTDRNGEENQYKKHVFAEIVSMCHNQKAMCIASCLQEKNSIENDSKTEAHSGNLTPESNASAVTTHDISSEACANSSFNEVLCSSIRRGKSKEQEKRDNSVERDNDDEISEGTKSPTCSLSEEDLLPQLPANSCLKQGPEENSDSPVASSELIPDISLSLLLPNRKESASLVRSVEAQPSFYSEHVQPKESDEAAVRIPSLGLCTLRDEVACDNDRKLLSPKKILPGNSPKKLLVLDINGLLADVVYHVLDGYTPDTMISGRSVFKRPFCDEFLDFCFARFNVGVWSSRMRRNVELILDFLMGNAKRKLLFVWDQYHCTNSNLTTIENRKKPLLVKKLKKLWEKYEPGLPWELGEYNESNTLLLDDSPYKAVCNPPYTAVFPTTYRYTDKEDNSLGPGGELRMYLEGLAGAENVQKYVAENPIGSRPITENNPSWRFYLQVIHACTSPERPPPRPTFHWQGYRWRQ